ncbi:hypothetical protein TWF718_006796 [Orbilia javanica]|uniref:Uncharacterized protein n=1 Tax=Orbilia javanica TaxID=47235 RepID=A0AAN8RHZ4_9PEZI
MDSPETEKEARSNSDVERELIDHLKQLINEKQKSKHQKNQRIIKLKLPRPALSKIAAYTSSCDTKVSITPNGMASTPSNSPALPSGCSTAWDRLDISETRLETFRRVSIHHVWMNSQLRQRPGIDKRSIQQPPAWIVHLESKGYGSIGDLCSRGVGMSTETLQRTLRAALKEPPKFFDISSTVKYNIHCMGWIDVEKSIEKLQSRNQMSKGTETATVQPADNNTTQPDPSKRYRTIPSLAADPLTPKSNTQDQSSMKRKREYRYPTTTPSPDYLPLNRPNLSSPPVTPPDTQRTKRYPLRREHFRNKTYLESESEYDSDEKYDWTSSGSNSDREGQKGDDGSSGEDEYLETESIISEDGERSLSDVTDESEIYEEEQDEEEELADLPPTKKRCTPSKSRRAEGDQKAKEMAKETPEKAVRKTPTGTPKRKTRNNTPKEESPAGPYDKWVGGNGNRQNSSRKETPVPSTPQTLGSTKKSSKGTDIERASPLKNETPGLENRNMQKGHNLSPRLSIRTTEPIHPDTRPIHPASTRENMVYFSPGFKAEEILTEFKALRNLTKHNYDHYKGVERRVAKLAEHQDREDEKLDKLIEEMVEVRRSMKEVTSAVKFFVAFCKGQSL